MDKQHYLNNIPDINDEKTVSVLDDMPLWSAPFGLKLLEKIIPQKNALVLDVGFGAGFPLLELAMRFGNSSKIVGVDPWEEAIARARQKIEIFGIENVEIIKGSAESIPMEDNTVDLITSNNGINNVEDMDLVLKELGRVCKPGGRFIQTLNLNTSLIEFYMAMEQVLNLLEMNDESEKIMAHIYSKRKPVGEIKNLLVNAGFEIISIEENFFRYTFADATTMLNHFFIRLAFMDSWKNIIPQEKQSEVFSLIEKKLNAKAEKEGGMQLSIPFVVIDSKKIMS